MKRFLGILLCLAGFEAFAEFNPLSVPDSSDIRRAASDRWFYSSLDLLRENKTELRTNGVGEKFQIRLEETDSSYAVIIAPEIFMDVDVYTERGVEKTVSAQYPADASGSWVLIKNSRTDKVDRLKMFFGSNSDVFVQFYEDGKKVFADFIVAGCFANKGVPLGISFESLLTMSFKDIYRLTQNSLSWKYVNIHSGLYEDKKQMIAVIKKFRNKIAYADDACYDEYGKPACISSGKEREVFGEDASKGSLSLSPAGFLKWVIDGLCEPENGAGTFIEPLRRSTVSLEPLSYASKLQEVKGIPVNFTLDWTRNLAAARLSVQSRKTYLYEDSGVDVTIEPFAAEITDNGPKQVVSYVENSGYQIERLKAVLYILGVTEPNFGYLAAVRRVIPAKNGQPEYKFFDQCALILPYFDSEGRFGVTIFDNGQELSLAQFMNRYKNSFVHLTRFNCSSKFAPLGYEVPVILNK